MSSLKNPNAPCLTCKHTKWSMECKDGSRAGKCTWRPTSPVAEPWSREHVTTTIMFVAERGGVFFREEDRLFRTCGAWEEKEAAE